MTIETRWALDADVQAEMTTEGGTFQNVVTEVRWQCFAKDTETGEEVRTYGSKSLPAPVDEASYIDVSKLDKATVIGWAEQIEPGFIDATEANTTARLEALLNAPEVTKMEIL